MASLKNEFSWSRTRAQAFAECRRRYWFGYYGHWGGWEPNANERARTLWVLKQLKTRHMWAGDIVHRTVAGALEGLRAGGKREAEETAERARALMRLEFDQSRNHKYARDPKRYCGLVEHELDNEVPDEEWGRLADHVRDCIRAFFDSPYPERLSKLPKGDWLPIEKLSSFQLNGDKVFVKPDFAYRDGDGAVIIDWKTGRRDEGGDALQLACYALYALDKGWAKAPDEVLTIEYNLARSQAREEKMSAARVEEASARIGESIKEMKALHLHPEEEFPVTDNEKNCRECPFQRMCVEKPLQD